MKELGTKGPDGLYRLKWGLCESIYHNGQPLHLFNQHGEPELNVELVHKIIKTGIPYTKGRKLFHFQTTADPIMAPTKEIAMQYANILFGEIQKYKTINKLTIFILEKTSHTLDFLNAGHLCIVPATPVVHEAFMSFGRSKFVLDWSRNKSEREKIEEGNEYRRLFDTVVNILQNHW